MSSFSRAYNDVKYHAARNYPREAVKLAVVYGVYIYENVVDANESSGDFSLRRYIIYIREIAVELRNVVSSTIFPRRVSFFP